MGAQVSHHPDRPPEPIGQPDGLLRLTLGSAAFGLYRYVPFRAFGLRLGLRLGLRIDHGAGRKRRRGLVGVTLDGLGHGWRGRLIGRGARCQWAG